MVVLIFASNGDLFAGDSEKAAVQAAESWLALVDEGEYGDSWNQGAGLFRGAITRAQWAQALNAVRKPMGEMIFRKMVSTTYTTALPGAPDGKVVVIQFNTSFTKKKAALESLTPMKDPDGQWRVSGYYIE